MRSQAGAVASEDALVARRCGHVPDLLLVLLTLVGFGLLLGLLAGVQKL
ncbi:hypothetical protein [Desertihabitans brevis]|nr:hypothetical protein [Desertihabitans brevis]